MRHRPASSPRWTGPSTSSTSTGGLERRLITGGVLDGPWGVVLAPHTWGRFADALLVGNEDGGQINAFDPRSGRFLGTVKDAHGNPVGGQGCGAWRSATASSAARTTS